MKIEDRVGTQGIIIAQITLALKRRKKDLEIGKKKFPHAKTAFKPPAPPTVA